MKYIDMETWKRKKHFDFFNQFDYPHFNVCANVDITETYNYIKEKQYPFFVSIVYVTSLAANAIKEFKYRIREGQIVEHDLVNPSFTVMAEDEVFSFCTSKFSNDYEAFKTIAANAIERTKNNVSLEDEPAQDDLLFITSLPWISFTSVTHPIHMNPTDSVPRIAWGRFFEENGRIKLPLSIQVHHALMDGVHVGQYFNYLQQILDNPGKYLR
ncbi:chloramphenicol acetyltransferase [Clostridium thermarum]|uniref:chloramphenicol acetyltransferase n=1 Tax=Clostridium thermarum TaxID=1716543 RepID=UPI0013D8BC9A|nr:chloramphenicol acetyltransferase [Clostridium thermarum]